MNPAEKSAILAQLRAHREADQLVKGRYWRGGKGCAVGCIAHKTHDQGVHAATAAMLGVPVQVAHLIDVIFECLPNADAMAWPERVVEAIVPDADHSLAWSRFAVRLLVDPDFGVIHTTDKADVRAAIEGVARCYRRRINGDEPTEAEWNAAGNAAREAREAWAVRAEWAEWAAREAREAWAVRAEWAEWAAREAWAAWAVRAAWAEWAAREAWAAWAVRAAWAEWEAREAWAVRAEWAEWAAGAAWDAWAAWAARCADWLVEILSTPTATETVA